ncbi:MAG: hypothetical protein AUH85_02710 [Chloroflexi bacterium 13_1_40CM_4_68_4]|nr:MAG: hypothetical protein AUH85_02710 [Chloroflexi bacterium 13_1_40CM_4_68_4]
MSHAVRSPRSRRRASPYGWGFCTQPDDEHLAVVDDVLLLGSNVAERGTDVLFEVSPKARSKIRDGSDPTPLDSR